MKLSTYSFFAAESTEGCHPLKLTISKMEVVETEFDAPFIVKLFTILNWPAVLKAAETVELADGFPVEKPTSVADNEQLLQKLHHLLFEIDVLEGQLECAETGQVVPIVDGKLKSIED